MIKHKLYTRRTKRLSTHKTITSSYPAYKRQIFYYYYYYMPYNWKQELYISFNPTDNCNALKT